MENTINFGIDLGTTNSAIAKFAKGEVIVFTNPQDYGRAILPSVVSYRKDKIVVGSKAKEFLEKDPGSVVGSFKRKMGTSEVFTIQSINDVKTPIELSAQVLKELKTFVDASDVPDAVVITIPASFDLIQSNATKEAGYQAGFSQVILLQEPIAASLAYTNMKKDKALENGQWLVYDLGGGTFDVALIRIQDGEMKVLDHEGDNFLGGTDFDAIILEKFLLPHIQAKYTFAQLAEEMKSASGKHNAAYYILLKRIEEARILLSSRSSADITVDGLTDDDGKPVDLDITLTRAEFNDLINPFVDRTIRMIQAITSRHALAPADLQFVLLVGGVTYTPYIRQRVEEALQVPVNCEVDPATAVAVGAAYYAATKQKEKSVQKTQAITPAISIKASYNKASKEQEEYFAARVTGVIQGLFYRIVRQDGGYDSGLTKLTEKISEDLPLVQDAFNYFTFTVYDEKNNVIETDLDSIGINSGYGISGQPLPEDICLEIDDYEKPGYTRLETVFQRNTILPTKRTLSFRINKHVTRNNEAEMLRIKVLQGSHQALPEANKVIGYITISGKQVSRDIAKGSDIEISISLSESQDLTVAAYLSMSDQEFKETFNPQVRHTPVDLLKQQVNDLRVRLGNEIKDTNEKKKEETTALEALKDEMQTVAQETESLTWDDVTDKRYQLEDKKRKIAQEIDNATRQRRLQKAKQEYLEVCSACKHIVTEQGNDVEKKVLQEIIAHEDIYLSGNSPYKILEKADELRALAHRIQWRSPEYLKELFNWLKHERLRIPDSANTRNLFESGAQALSNEDWIRLKEINVSLLNMMHKGRVEEIITKIGFG
ncbi:MAG TPA: Hsp70 family protein [Ohtaekwangia sp.]|uniref:Hsp70 family protein n=1 Tax=Ohtaekwangia sp. TaxID=2066019 RepID=UPI002F949480